MASQQLPARIDLRPDRLRHAENDAAHQRAPHIAEPADNDRLEAEDPMAGSKLVRTARNTPAMAMMASESAIAMANTWRVSRPINCATA
jgi:hypothetical protein